MRKRYASIAFMLALTSLLIATAVFLLDLRIVFQSIPYKFLHHLLLPLLILIGGVLTVMGAVLALYSLNKKESRKNLARAGLCINIILFVIFLYLGLMDGMHAQE